MAKDKCKVITGKDTRWAYVNVWEPKRAINGGRAKYSVRLIIPKTDTKTVDNIKSAMYEAYLDGINKLMLGDDILPPYEEIQLPLIDGDEAEIRNADVYRGCYYINSHTQIQPKIVDANLHPVTRHSDVYSGVYGRASIHFYVFNSQGKKGVACGLDNLQLIRPGEPLAWFYEWIKLKKIFISDEKKPGESLPVFGSDINLALVFQHRGMAEKQIEKIETENPDLKGRLHVEEREA